MKVCEICNQKREYIIDIYLIDICIDCILQIKELIKTRIKKNFRDIFTLSICSFCNQKTRAYKINIEDWGGYICGCCLDDLLWEAKSILECYMALLEM